MLGFIVQGNHFRPPETLLSLSAVWTNEGFYKQAYISVYLKLQECLITKANSNSNSHEWNGKATKANLKHGRFLAIKRRVRLALVAAQPINTDHISQHIPSYKHNIHWHSVHLHKHFVYHHNSHLKELGNQYSHPSQHWSDDCVASLAYRVMG